MTETIGSEPRPVDPAAAEGNNNRRFHVDVPDDELAELRRCIAATRWPSKELVADRSQGVQLEPLQELARYWETDYDWRRAEARLNALPQFTTEIAGVDFYHSKPSLGVKGLFSNNGTFTTAA